MRPRTAIIIVDVQNDFISGSLAISNCPAQQNGEEVSQWQCAHLVPPSRVTSGGGADQPADRHRALRPALLQPGLAPSRPRLLRGHGAPQEVPRGQQGGRPAIMSVIHYYHYITSECPESIFVVLKPAKPIIAGHKPRPRHCALSCQDTILR